MSSADVPAEPPLGERQSRLLWHLATWSSEHPTLLVLEKLEIATRLLLNHIGEDLQRLLE